MRARNRCAPTQLATALLVIVSLVGLTGARRSAAAAITTTARVGPPDEQLLAGLNESLSRFLQVGHTGAAAPSVAALTLDNDDHNDEDQQQQQAVALKKISCSKISLVVMAQRALNASANLAALRKLVECRQENLLDLELEEALERSTTATAAATGTTTPMQPSRGSPKGQRAAAAAAANDHRLATDRHRPESDNNSNNHTRHQAPAARQLPRDRPIVRQQHERQIELCASGQACASSGNQSANSQEAVVQERPGASLHFGAKLTLTLVVLVVTLVAAATYLDYSQTPTKRKKLASGGQSAGPTTNLLDRAGLQQHKVSRENNAARFFLDLGPQAAKLRDYRSLSISSNSSSNLFCSSQSVASSSAPILPAGHHHHHHHHHYHQQQQQQQQQQRVTTSNSATCQHLPCGMYESNLQLHMAQSSALSTGGDQASTSASNEQPAAEREHGLAWQLLLAFSLRHTGGQIFERQRQQQAETDQADWLHGLRFFSMIWVIVIHSYNFALRWMFFANTSTLDGIYKSTASQFIANGSFACDSFFFVGGFLLPYLALRPTKATTTSSTRRTLTQSSDLLGECDPEQEQGRGHEAGQQQQRHGVDEQHARQQVAAANDSAGNLCCCCCCAPFCCSWCSASASLTEPCRKQRVACDRQQARSLLLEPCSSTSEAASAPGTCLATNCICFRGGPITPSPSGEPDGRQAMGAHSKQRHLAENINERAHVQHHVHIPQCCQASHSSSSSSSSSPPPSSQPPALATEDLSTSANRSKTPKEGAANSEPEASVFTWRHCLANVLRRYVRMTPLMMAIIGLCANLLRYLGEGPVWQESTMMYDDWCRRNWWVNALFLHNFVNRENMCLSHSWYSAVDFQLFLCGQLILLALASSKRLGLLLLLSLLLGSPLITMLLTLRHHLPAVPLISSVNEQTMNLYYGEIYIKPYSRASPYLIGILLAFLMRTTRLAQCRLKRWQLFAGWTLAIGLLLAIILAMQPAMNGHTPSELSSALYSGWARPLWACATGWIIFACMTQQAGLVGKLLGARCLVPLSKLTYPAFLIHPIIMASFYGTRQASFQFSHYLMLYLILGNIVITYASAFLLATLVELPFLMIERVISRRLFKY